MGAQHRQMIASIVEWIGVDGAWRAQTLPAALYRRPAELVAPDLLGCLLVKRQADAEPLWGVIVETEAYCQSEPACHGHRPGSPSNETLLGEPGRWYVYLTYGMHHCVKRAPTSRRSGWA
jgi:DNA-3-methyladenine glycosylase